MWFEQDGESSEAIRHALAAEDFERAAGLTELALPALRRGRQEGAIRNWVEALPDELLRVRPVLNVGFVGALVASGEFEGVEARLQDVERCVQMTTNTGDESSSMRSNFGACRARSSCTEPHRPWFGAMFSRR